MNTNDPIDEILRKAAVFEKIANAPARELPAGLLEEINAMFSKPLDSLGNDLVNVSLSDKDLTSLLLMIISGQTSSALDLIDALKKKEIAFEGGNANVIGLLQKLELEGHLTTEKKLRRGRWLKFYSLTDEGRQLVQHTESSEQVLYSIAAQILRDVVA